MMQILTAFGAGAIAGLVLATGHYAIDRIRRGVPIHPVLAYVCGVLTLNAAFTGWALLARPDPLIAAAGVWIIAIVAGAFDLGCYVVDRLADAGRDEDELEERRGREADRR